MSDVHENLDWLERQLNEVCLRQEESERRSQEKMQKDAQEKERFEEWKMQQEWNDQDQKAEMVRMKKEVQSQQEQIASAAAKQQHFISCVFEEWKKDREEDRKFKQEVLVELKYLRDDVIEWKRRLYNKTVRFNEHPQVFIFGDDSGDSPAESTNNTNQVKKRETVLEETKGCDECNGMVLLDNLQNSLSRLEEGVPALNVELEVIHKKVEELKSKIESIEDFQKSALTETKFQVDQIIMEQKDSFMEIQKIQREELEALRNVVLGHINEDHVETHAITPTTDLITPSVTPLPSRESSFNNNNGTHNHSTNTRRTIDPTRPPNYLSHFPTLVYRLFPEHYGDAARREALLGWINSSTSQEEILEKITKMYRSAIHNTRLAPDDE